MRCYFCPILAQLLCSPCEQGHPHAPTVSGEERQACQTPVPRAVTIGVKTNQIQFIVDLDQN